MLQWTETTLTHLVQDGAPASLLSGRLRSDDAPESDESETQRPSIADRATFSVRWGGRTCYLGDTLPFRLLERLARRPDRLFSYGVLLQDVWRR